MGGGVDRSMRGWTLRVTLAGLAMLACPGAHAAAQETEPPEGLAGMRAAAVQGVGRKLSSLASAVPEHLHDWRPMEGVRSFREVFALVAAEGRWFGATWGGRDGRPLGSFETVRAELEAAPWEELVAALSEGSDTYAAAVRRAAGTPGSEDVALGARTLPAREALALLHLDMHEHLGQAIAYARINGIVPPWSRER